LVNYWLYRKRVKTIFFFKTFYLLKILTKRWQQAQGSINSFSNTWQAVFEGVRGLNHNGIIGKKNNFIYKHYY
jgi:hypothetical protein